MKGTTSGTQGAAYQPVDNVIRLALVTSQTIPPAKGGTCEVKCDDSYGVFCSLTSTWTVCDAPFASIKQEGWGAPVAFDATQILLITFGAGRYSQATVSWDFWVDDVTFY
jgi:hypothetical protein